MILFIFVKIPLPELLVPKFQGETVLAHISFFQGLKPGKDREESKTIAYEGNCANVTNPTTPTRTHSSKEQP